MAPSWIAKLGSRWIWRGFTMITWLTRAVCVALLFANVAAHAQSGTPAAYLIVNGEVATPLTMSEADFKALPRSSVTATDASGNQTTYAGVKLADILLKAGVPLQQNLKGTDVAKYLDAQGADGFIAVFALPEFDQGSFLVADTANNLPLPAGTGPLEIISPNETRHARWVKQLTLLRIGKI
jgi:DMSO/TMAO reductase YedYZ molybdopterin-dependent catalytic subunit